MTTDTKVVLISSDGDEFPVDMKVAEKSIFIKSLVNNLSNKKDDDDDDDDDDSDEDDEDKEDEVLRINVQNVRSAVLKLIIQWCEHYRDVDFKDDEQDEDAKKSAPANDYDKKFLNVDQEMLYEIILGANYLNIKPLLNAGCKEVAEMIRGKSPDEIRKTFNIVNDFSPEEERAIKRENEWAEDR